MKHRLLGFDSKKNNSQKEAKNNEVAASPMLSVVSPQKSHLRLSNSPDKHHSFLADTRNRKLQEWGETLAEDDWELLAEFEEENSRKGHF